MFKFEGLRVYQESIEFIDLIYETTKLWPNDELFGLISQLRRAAVSIALNVSEGSSRTKKDYRRFLDMALGSCFECATIILIAKKRSYINNEEFEILYEYCDKLARMINALKKSIL